MNVDSSFSRLFGLSRYARDMEYEQYRFKQNRRELFAVAAVAFTAKYNQHFARSFLMRVAGVPVRAVRHDFRWEPQKTFCADLLITDCDSGEQYVVEFKVGARLMQKQHSDSTEFYREGGYGRAIRNQFPKARIYTALTQQRDFDDSANDSLQRRARTWKELIPPSGRESPLVKDLLDSLGDLGISVLRLRNIKHMKNAKHASTAVDIYDLLRSIMHDFKKSPLDIGSDEIYDWVGMYVRPRSNDHVSLRRWLGHRWSYVGWMGYLLPKGSKKPELSVWLSFGEHFDDRREQSISVLKRVIRNAEVGRSPKDNDLIVKVKASCIDDEKEWFTQTLNLVLNKAVPARRRGKIL
jgi:hypothetical protein